MKLTFSISETNKLIDQFKLISPSGFQLKKCEELASLWQELCAERASVSLAAAALGGGASDGGECGRAACHTERSSPRVVSCVSDAVALITRELELERAAASTPATCSYGTCSSAPSHCRERADVLLTGSLHLVGAALSVLAPPGSADSPVRPWHYERVDSCISLLICSAA